MRIEQQPHSMYSLNSSRGALKSGAIQWKVSFAEPALHGQLVRTSFTSLASGWPFSVSTTSSPVCSATTISRR